MRRREFLSSICGIPVALSLPEIAHGQPTQKRPLILWMSAFPPPKGPEDLKFSAHFLEGMAGLGYVRERDFTFEFRSGRGLPDVTRLAEEAVAAQPSVIVAAATLEAVALGNATSHIPIVCPALADAVHLGLIQSEARPGRNITGIEPYISGLPAKQIELAREVVSGATKIGLLTNDLDPKGPPQTRELNAAISSLGLTAISANANQESDIEAAFAKLAAERVEVVIVLQTNLLLLRRFVISDLALKRHLPTVYGYRENVIAGGLASYGVNLSWCYSRGAYFVDRILRGAKPGDLPIEFPTSLWLAANTRTAKSLGIGLSPNLIGRADEVIE
jgi:putative tryptophan/tyrosine transport system substrate-binding protein